MAKTKADLGDVQEAFLPFYIVVNPSMSSKSKKNRPSALI